MIKSEVDASLFLYMPTRGGRVRFLDELVS